MNPIIQAAIRILGKKQEVRHEYNVRQYITKCPKDFDRVTFVNDNAKTASYVDSDSELVFVVII